MQLKVRFQKAGKVIQGFVDRRIFIAEFGRIDGLLDGWK